MSGFALINGMVFSAGFPKPQKVDLLVAGDRIERIGKPEEATGKLPKGIETIDLKGRLVLPGFQDCHLHPLIGAEDLIDCSLNNLENPEEYSKRILVYLKENPQIPFIRGNGLVFGIFPPPGPHKKWLDKLVSDRPVFLKGLDGHSALVNSKALDMAGIGKNTADPESGWIERDPISGDPTGVLREWPAMLMVTNLLPKPGSAQLLKGAGEFLQMAARLGITSVHDARGKERYMEIYSSLAEKGELSMRLGVSLFCDPAKDESQISGIEALRKKYSRPGISYKSAKIFLDGVVEGQTAFLIDPYENRPDHYGEPIWTADNLNKVGAALDKAGWQMHFHAVGDAAVRMALDAIEVAMKKNGKRDSRHVISHADLISDADLERFKSLGAVVNFSPSWFYCDKNFLEVTLPSLGSARAEKLYRLKSVCGTGAKIAFSSDWPFGGDYVTVNPLDSIQTGVTRRGIQNDKGDPLFMNQAVDLKTMIECHTLGSAFANFNDHETGSIEVGKKADIIVLDRNIFEIPDNEISKAKILLTLFDGKPVWRAPELS